MTELELKTYQNDFIFLIDHLNEFSRLYNMIISRNEGIRFLENDYITSEEFIETIEYAMSDLRVSLADMVDLLSTVEPTEGTAIG